MTILAVIALALGQLASPDPALFGGDPRIRTVPFNENQVVSLSVADGFAAVVSLSPEERAESIVVGDSVSWQVTASKRGDHIVVKPLAGASQTNMVVITGERRYVFMLEPDNGSRGAPFVLKFSYPDANGASITASATRASFKFSGSRSLFPQRMTDDGVRTTIAWSPTTTLPAVFAIEKGGGERLVNGRMVDGDYVVEDIAERFVFRSGRVRATAKRQSLDGRQ